MLRFISFVVAVIILTYPPQATIAYAPVRTLNEYTVQELIEHFALQYDVSAEKMRKTMFCESSYNPLAKGDYRNGKPTSFGLSQIHLPAHPEILEEQAYNPVFATEFMASEFSKGNIWKWSCARKLGFVR